MPKSIRKPSDFYPKSACFSRKVSENCMVFSPENYISSNHYVPRHSSLSSTGKIIYPAPLTPTACLAAASRSNWSRFSGLSGFRFRVFPVGSGLLRNPLFPLCYAVPDPFPGSFARAFISDNGWLVKEKRTPLVLRSP